MKFGDVLEVRTSRGLAYVQYTHRHPVFGCVIRVLPGVFGARPETFAALVAGRELYFALFPAAAATSRRLVSIIANEEIPERARPFPLFKAGNRDRRTKRVHEWWLWDGDRSWRVGQLTPEQRALPVQSIWNLALLVSRIDHGWMPEDEATAPN